MATAGERRGAGPERAFHDPLPDAGVVRLDPEEGRHLVRVRRVRAGDEVVLFDGRGRSRLGRLVDERVGKDGGPAVELVGPYPAREPLRDVAVAVAFPGAGRADDLVFALAELGVSVLVPLKTTRGEADLDALTERRAERFLRLAREAAKVNGRSRLLRIDAPRDVSDLLARGVTRGGLGGGDGVSPAGRNPRDGYAPVLLDTEPRLPSLPVVLAGLVAPVLLVGPEGGFTAEEVASCRAAGAPEASLGGCALRTELAAVAAAAVALTGP